MERLSAESPLARSLEASRSASNAAVVRARRANPRFDTEAFSAFVCGPLDRLVRVIAAAAPHRAGAAAAALFDVALELFAADLLGPSARSAALADAWSRVLPAAAPFVAADPRGVAAAVSNLVLNIQRERSDAAARWVEAAVPLAERSPDTGAFLDAGLVLAWRCGLAHMRDTAIARWRGLPEPTRAAALRVPAPGRLPPDVEQRLDDPWWTPAAAGGGTPDLRVVARAGGFRGFGGPFGRPPHVGCDDGQLIAFDRDGCWTVYADGCGVVLKRLGDDPPSALDFPSPSFTIDRAGSVAKGDRRRSFPELRDPTSFASTDWTLAVTTRHSHWVFLVAVAVAEQHEGDR